MEETIILGILVLLGGVSSLVIFSILVYSKKDLIFRLINNNIKIGDAGKEIKVSELSYSDMNYAIYSHEYKKKAEEEENYFNRCLEGILKDDIDLGRMRKKPRYTNTNVTLLS